MHLKANMLAGFVFAVISLFAATDLFGQEEVIEKRKALMKANNAAIKAIKEAEEQKDYGTIQVKAKEIMGGLEKAADLFPKGSTSEKSRAHPDIWEKPDQFKKSLTNAVKAADALSKAAAKKDEGEVNAKLKDLGNTKEGACGECHKVFRTDFRKEKKE